MDELNKKINTLKKIELKSEEKQAIFSRISENVITESFKESENVRNPEPVRLYKVSWVSSLFINNFNKKFMGTIATILILLLGGGTSFAAENSVPGDVLYPIKTEINERVVDALTVGSKSSAKWESEKAERRLQELEEMLEDGEISDEDRVEIEEKLNKHIEKFEERIAKMEEKAESDDNEDDKKEIREDMVSLKSDFEARMIAHLGIMGQLQSGRMEYDKDEIEDLLDEIEEKTKNIKDERTESEKTFINNSVNSNDNSSFDGQLRAVEKMIENTESKLIRFEIDSDSDAYDLIADAKDNVADAKDELENGSTTKAYELLFEARRDVNKADVLTRGNFKNVDLGEDSDDGDDSDDDLSDEENDDEDDSNDDNGDNNSGKPDDNPGRGNGRD